MCFGLLVGPLVFAEFEELATGLPIPILIGPVEDLDKPLGFLLWSGFGGGPCGSISP